MRRRAFEQLIGAGARNVPPRFRAFLSEVAVLVSDEPSRAQKRRAGVPSRQELLALYEGTPRSARYNLAYRLPDTITFFQGPFERLFGNNPENLRQEIVHTLRHELGHALGFSERAIRRLEARWRGSRGS